MCFSCCSNKYESFEGDPYYDDGVIQRSPTGGKSTYGSIDNTTDHKIALLKEGSLEYRNADAQYFTFIRKIYALKTCDVPQKLVTELEAVAKKGHPLALLRLGFLLNPKQPSYPFSDYTFRSSEVSTDLKMETCFLSCKEYFEKQAGFFTKPSPEVEFLLGCCLAGKSVYVLQDEEADALFPNPDHEAARYAKAHSYIKKAAEKNQPEALLILAEIERESSYQLDTESYKERLTTMFTGNPVNVTQKRESAMRTIDEYLNKAHSLGLQIARERRVAVEKKRQQDNNDRISREFDARRRRDEERQEQQRLAQQQKEEREEYERTHPEEVAKRRRQEEKRRQHEELMEEHRKQTKALEDAAFYSKLASGY